VFKVLICGDRHWNNPGAIDRELKKLIKRHGPNMIVIEGGAPGADQEAKKVANDHSIHVAEVKALWETRHRGAGPQRNQAMLELGPDLVLAFHPNLAHSKGTKDMVWRARKADVDVKVVKK
jgi:hypothetical protein